MGPHLVMRCFLGVCSHLSPDCRKAPCTHSFRARLSSSPGWTWLPASLSPGLTQTPAHPVLGPLHLLLLPWRLLFLLLSLLQRKADLKVRLSPKPPPAVFTALDQSPVGSLSFLCAPSTHALRGWLSYQCLLAWAELGELVLTGVGVGASPETFCKCRCGCVTARLESQRRT